MPLQFFFVHELPRAIQWPAVNVQYEHLLPKGFVESRLRGQLIDVSIFVCKVLRGYRKSDRPIEFSNYSDHRRGNVRRCIYFCVSVGMLEKATFRLPGLVELTARVQGGSRRGQFRRHSR